MIIAGEYTFPIRSLAPARSLLPHSLRGALICAIFISSFFRYPIRRGGGDDGVAVLRFAPRSVHRLVLRLVFSFRLYVRCSLFIHTVASRKRRRFSSITAPRLSRAPVPSNPPPCRPLPHLLRLFRLVPRPVLRLAHRLVLMPSRLPFRSHPVPSFSMCRTNCRPSCGRTVLFSSFFRSPHALLSSSSHDRMTQDGCEYRIMATLRAGKERTSRRKRAAYLSD